MLVKIEYAKEKHKLAKLVIGRNYWKMVTYTMAINRKKHILEFKRYKEEEKET